LFKVLSLGGQNFERRGAAAGSELEVIRTFDVKLKNKKFDFPLQGKNRRLQLPESDRVRRKENCDLLGYYAVSSGRLRLKNNDTSAETRVRLSAKRTSRFKSAGASVQSITGSRGVRNSSSNAGYMFRGSVKGAGYPLYSPVSHSLPLPCGTVCHHISTGL